MKQDYKENFEQNLNYEIDKSNLLIVERIDSDGRISFIRANDGRYYIYKEQEHLFEYPSDNKVSALEMYKDIISQ